MAGRGIFKTAEEATMADELTREDIARLAYRLWELAGKPEGMDLEIWTEAERRYTTWRRQVRTFWVQEAS